jgi:polysaccharide export outer membrane protein
MVFKQQVILSALLLALVGISGCSSTKSMLLPSGAILEPVNYLIGPGDNLQVFVWRNPDLSSNVIVRPDGKISAPLIDELDVNGLQAIEVARSVEAILSRYIREPKVSVIISGFNGTSGQQIRVIGNATTPKVIPYRAGMTLLDVMIEVQGLSEFADGDNAQLIRIVNGEQKQYTVLLDSLIREGNIAHNRALSPGDTIIIPEPWL